MKINFFDSATNTINVLKKRKSEVHFDYDEIMHEAHLRAFTVAKITRLDLLDDIKQSLEVALKNGQGFKEWSKGLKPTLAKKGWLGSISVVDPKSGEVKDIYVGSKRLKRIYETNMRVSYAKSRYESQMNATGEYFRYVAVLDSKTRPGHSKLHGLVLPKTHKFWDKNYPPNDWGCRCEVQVLNEFEVKSKGYHVTKADALPNIATPDWAYSFKNESENLENLLIKKGASAKDFEAIKMQTWQKGLDDLVDEVIVKDNQKTPLNIVQVGLLSEALASVASKILNKEVKSGGIILTKKELIHASPKRKDAYNHAFRVEEIRHIPTILADESKAYVDLRDKKQNLVFIFDDEKDSKRVNLIPIEISKTHKKFKQSNYVITLDKNIKEDILGAIKGGEIIKLK